MELKSGYIEVYVMGADSCILNSNGFNFDDLVSMNKQIKEPEEFEGVEEAIYVFRPEYSEPQKDELGQIEAEGYWEFEEDKYTKEMKKEIDKELERLEEESKNNFYLDIGKLIIKKDIGPCQLEMKHLLCEETYSCEECWKHALDWEF